MEKYLKPPSVFTQVPPSQIPSIISHSLKSSPSPPRPLPKGQSSSKALDPSLGHCSHSDPQASPLVQQQVCLVAFIDLGFIQNRPRYWLKHCSARTSKHLIPVGSKAHPGLQSHEASPSRFSQNPFSQKPGCSTHSLMSWHAIPEGFKRYPSGHVHMNEPIMFWQVPGSGQIPRFWHSSTSSQFWPSEERMYPSGQSQVKLPRVFLHLPFRQMSYLTQKIKNRYICYLFEHKKKYLSPNTTFVDVFAISFGT